MSNTPSSQGPDRATGAAGSAAEADLATAAALLGPAFAGRALALHLLDAPGAALPQLVEGEAGASARMAQETGGRVLASLTLAGEGPRADLFIAPPPDKVPGADRILEKPAARAALRFWPSGFELAKYAIERRWQARRVLPEPRPGQGRQGALPVAPRPAILIALHWLEPGGAESFGIETIGWALAAGLRVVLLTERPAPDRLAARLPQSPDLTRLPLARFLPGPLWGEFLAGLAARENIVAVHIQHCAPAYAALPALRAARPGLLVIDTLHIFEHHDGGYVALSREYDQFFDIHHVISHQLEELLPDRGRVRLGRLLPSGSTPARFSLAPETGRLTVAFVGRMTHQKRPLLALRSIRVLARWARSAGVDLRVEVVGDGPYLEAFRRGLARAGLIGRVTLHPAGADVPAVMGRADLLLIPSANEGLALVGYEAVSHGTIPISTDVGAQSELIPPELLVPASPLGLAHRIRTIVARLWTDPAFRARAEAGLDARMQSLAADPDAEAVLMPLYRAATQGAPA